MAPKSRSPAAFGTTIAESAAEEEVFASDEEQTWESCDWDYANHANIPVYEDNNYEAGRGPVAWEGELD